MVLVLFCVLGSLVLAEEASTTDLEKLKNEIGKSDEDSTSETVTEEEDGEIEWNFDFIDNDKNGIVTKQEYREALQKYHKDWTFLECVNQVETIFQRADQVQ